MLIGLSDEARGLHWGSGQRAVRVEVLRAILGKLSKGSGCQNGNIQTCGAHEGLFLTKLLS
jgi:hypothetical protein